MTTETNTPKFRVQTRMGRGRGIKRPPGFEETDSLATRATKSVCDEIKLRADLMKMTVSEYMELMVVDHCNNTPRKWLRPQLAEDIAETEAVS